MTDFKTDKTDVDSENLHDAIKSFKNIFNTYKILRAQYIFENELVQISKCCNCPSSATNPCSVCGLWLQANVFFFSKLKVVKNHLQANMNQDSVSNFSIMSTEAGILDTLKTENLIKDFTEKKTYKAGFI